MSNNSNNGNWQPLKKIIPPPDLIKGNPAPKAPPPPPRPASQPTPKKGNS